MGTSGTDTAVALPGDPTRVGGTYSSFGGGIPSINASGDVAFYANVSNGRSGLFVASDGTHTPVARVGDPAPVGGTYWGISGNNISISDAGDVAFYANTSRGWGIFKAVAVPSTDCNDGDDNDGDTLIDYPNDPGCYSPGSSIENPQCQDGSNNDPADDSLIDFDGGLSALGYVATAADPQCTYGWQVQEAQGASWPCGLGTELALLLPPLMWLSWRRRRSLR